MLSKVTLQCNEVTATTVRTRLLNYLFMESHAADRAQLLDKVSNYVLRFTPSHYKVAITHAHAHTHTDRHTHTKKKHAAFVKMCQKSCILSRQLVTSLPLTGKGDGNSSCSTYFNVHITQ